MTLSLSVRHDTNPFIEGLEIKTRDKSVRLSSLGKEDNVLINESTGEVHGTHVTTYKTVDSGRFVKLFADNIGMVFNLRSAGIKAFTVLMWAVQERAISKDKVELGQQTLKDFMAFSETTLNLSTTTLTRGIAELVEAQIIAKATRRGDYFINPSFCFNGDRIAFTTMLIRAGAST